MSDNFYPTSEVVELGHNANVCFCSTKYLSENGVFYQEEVSMDDRTRHVLLLAKEALSLLEWIQKHKDRLEQIASEDRE